MFVLPPEIHGSRMNSRRNQDSDPGQLDDMRRSYRRNVQGALVRSGASLMMWVCALVSFWTGAIQINHFAGISVSIAYLVLINVPILWILKRSTQLVSFKYISLALNILEVIGYTSIIYFAGGIQSSYLIALYCALITYVGIVGTRSVPYVIAVFASICFSLMVVLEHFGFLPTQDIVPNYHCAWKTQLAILSAAIGLLFVTAFIASYAANLLKRNRERLRRQNADLIRAKESAENASRAKSDFLANMSHELRTPLNHIIGFTELVVEKQCGDLNEVQGEYLNDALQSSRHLLSLINDILDLAKVETGKLELKVAEIHLRRILESSLNMVKEKALRHQIQLLTNMDGVPEVIRGDERKLKQILYNLLSNAMKFVPDGGSVTLSGRYVSFREGQWFNHDGESVGFPLNGDNGSMRKGDGIQISVQDTGIGINREDLERIFDPFEQGDNSASRQYQGTGLGLSLTKRLVELHGGKIWAESEGEGKGSKFIFVIPA